jgi:hypothetical protein
MDRMKKQLPVPGVSRLKILMAGIIELQLMPGCASSN